MKPKYLFVWGGVACLGFVAQRTLRSPLYFHALNSAQQTQPVAKVSEAQDADLEVRLLTASDQDVLRWVSQYAANDPQAIRMTRSLAIQRMKQWLSTNPQAAVEWLVSNQSLSVSLRRLLAKEVAEVAPVALLKTAANASDASAMLDFLSTGLTNIAAIDKEEAQGLFESSLKHFPRASDLIAKCWIDALQEQRPDYLLALAQSTKSPDLQNRIRTAGLVGTAKKDLPAALRLVNDAKSGTFSSHTIASLMLRAQPENLDIVSAFIKNSPEPTKLAVPLAVAAAQWPEEGRASLLQWATDQGDTATGHLIIANLLPNMDSLSPELVMSLLDQMIVDGSTELSAAKTMARRGDIETWISWIQQRGGISPNAAQSAVEGLSEYRPRDFDAWQRAHPNVSLSNLIVKKG